VRGGGGNFGIVTSFELRLHQMEREVIAGNVVFPIERAHEHVRPQERPRHVALFDRALHFTVLAADDEPSSAARQADCLTMRPVASSCKFLAVSPSGKHPPNARRCPSSERRPSCPGAASRRRSAPAPNRAPRAAERLPVLIRTEVDFFPPHTC
jgi:FAD/FMN-containing dehydrogenase